MFEPKYGIEVGLGARAPDEEAKEGKENITPYWRTLKNCRLVYEKYPGWVAAQKKLL